MNSKTTLPLLDAAAHDEVVDVLRRLTVAYPNNTSDEVACCVARCALEHAGVRAEAIDEFMAAVPKCSKPNGDKHSKGRRRMLSLRSGSGGGTPMPLR